MSVDIYIGPTTASINIRLSKKKKRKKKKKRGEKEEEIRCVWRKLIKTKGCCTMEWFSLHHWFLNSGCRCSRLLPSPPPCSIASNPPDRQPTISHHHSCIRNKKESEGKGEAKKKKNNIVMCIKFPITITLQGNGTIVSRNTICTLHIRYMVVSTSLYIQIIRIVKSCSVHARTRSHTPTPTPTRAYI